MLPRRVAVTLLLAALVPASLQAQSETTPTAGLWLELNAVQDVGGACRLTFVARNETGVAVDKAVFETVIFDQAGSVVSLSLFDFQDLPVDRPRVRQFDLTGRSCDTVGQALINGASTCRVAGADSPVCEDALSLSSRLDVELLG